MTGDTAWKTNNEREYMSYVQDIIYTPEVQQLDTFSQHGSFSRLYHSISVSYLAFLVCKYVGLDACAAARGGLLHDLFFYEWFEQENLGLQGSHVFNHPVQALQNAQALCELTPIEEDIIVNHMFPFSHSMPKSMESFLVSNIDKACATNEAVTSLFVISKRIIKRLSMNVVLFLRTF